MLRWKFNGKCFIYSHTVNEHQFILLQNYRIIISMLFSALPIANLNYFTVISRHTCHNFLPLAPPFLTSSRTQCHDRIQQYHHTHQFSIISLSALAGRWTTSPAAILFTTVSSSFLILPAMFFFSSSSFFFPPSAIIIYSRSFFLRSSHFRYSCSY